MEPITSDLISRLDPPARLALISQLWDSLDQNQVPLSHAQEVKLERCLATVDQDPRDGVPWTALKAEMELGCP